MANIRTIGTLTGASIGSNNNILATASTAVFVGDIVVALMAQQTNLTASSCTDNLSSSYSAQNAGTVATAISGRLFYARISANGTLGTVTIAATSSTNDFAAAFAVFGGPFDTSPVDANAANTVGDVSDPFQTTSSGALAQPFELVVGWSANNANATWSGTSGTTVAASAPRANANAVIGSIDTTSTSAQTISFTGTVPANNAMGIMSFKQMLLHPQVCL